MAEITNAAWKFVLLDGVTVESALTDVRDDRQFDWLMRRGVPLYALHLVA
jgi:hypothetical protein